MQNITIRQVADRAKVSIKTLSRVVNNEDEIAEDTPQRVLATIGELGYTSKMLARSPATQRSHMIGLVVPDICNPFFAVVARGVKKIARIHSYWVVIANTDMNVEFVALELLVSHGVDGIVIVTMSGEREKVAKLTDRRRIMIYQNGFMHPNVGRALAATYLGGRIAVEHLDARGHQFIGMIIGGSGNPKLAQRVRAHQDVMLEHGLGFETLKVESGIATPHGMSHHGDRANGAATQNFSALLLQRSAGTGHYPGRYELGRKVPADFAIAGFGDIAYAALATPALTTVRLDKREIGRASTRLLIDKINNPSRDFPVTESFPELIVREST